MLRRITISALAAVALLSVTVGTPRADEGADVPMFRGNAARTGEMPGPGPDPAHGVQVRWRFATSDRASSTPVVADGVVYVGSGDGPVYALEAAQPVFVEERGNGGDYGRFNGCTRRS